MYNFYFENTKGSIEKNFTIDPFVYYLMIIWHIFMASNALSWLSGVTPAQQEESTLIGVSGTVAFKSNALEMTQISVQRPISSISS